MFYVNFSFSLNFSALCYAIRQGLSQETRQKENQLFIQLLSLENDNIQKFQTCLHFSNFPPFSTLMKIKKILNTKKNSKMSSLKYANIMPNPKPWDYGTHFLELLLSVIVCYQEILCKNTCWHVTIFFHWSIWPTKGFSLDALIHISSSQGTNSPIKSRTINW